MKEVDSKKPTKFEETHLPNMPYSCYDSGNNKIVVRPPIPERHTPHDGVAQDPAVYMNAGYAIRNYDTRTVSKRIDEKDPQGGDVIYECHDFYSRIDHPNQATKSNYTLEVVVHYGSDGYNYTKTFYDKPGSII